MNKWLNERKELIFYYIYIYIPTEYILEVLVGAMFFVDNIN